MPDGWPHNRSPFHAGEQQVQERQGVRAEMEAFARKVVRDRMPEQHRAFYAQLPYVLLGTVDARGRPWASLVPGRPGFLASRDVTTLEVAASPLPGDPLNGTLKPGAAVGVLGIKLETRRRNRLAGHIAGVRPDGFTIAVEQAFGNCPQYIQARTVEVAPAAKPVVVRGDSFDARTQALIAGADTLFIATAAADGADVSHRGGKPGFVRVEDERTFVFPDFAGNNHFNTVGNLVLEPRAGFLFVDFDRGDLVQLSGTTEIVWDGDEVCAFAGAERLIRFHVDEAVRLEGALPLRFAGDEASPMLVHTGSWQQAAETLAAERQRDTYLPYEVSGVARESEDIVSLVLRRADGRAVASHEPGQFLPIRLDIDGEPVTRTYTVSDAPNGETFRLSIKREGLVSSFLHEHAAPGFRLEAMAPRGVFTLDATSDRPVVLLSAGVGVTPMLAMLNRIVAEGRRTRYFRRTFFIHGARNGGTHAFGAHVRALSESHDSVTAHIRYSRPTADDRLGESHDSEGHVDLALIQRLLPLDDYDFYLCGPAPFMAALNDGLLGLGVRPERIHSEAFGPAAVPAPAQVVQRDPVAVSFADSGVEATWTPAAGTLLDLAESAGLEPAFSCRSGVCGTCATRLTSGAVDYPAPPLAPHGDDEVLLCQATPHGGVALDL